MATPVPNRFISDNRLSRRMQLLRIRQMELRASRDVVLHRMQHLQAQITIRRREGNSQGWFTLVTQPMTLVSEKDLWKQKYLIEKTQIPAIEEQHRTASVRHYTFALMVTLYCNLR